MGGKRPESVNTDVDSSPLFLLLPSSLSLSRPFSCLHHKVAGLEAATVPRPRPSPPRLLSASATVSRHPCPVSTESIMGASRGAQPLGWRAAVSSDPTARTGKRIGGTTMKTKTLTALGCLLMLGAGVAPGVIAHVDLGPHTGYASLGLWQDKNLLGNGGTAGLSPHVDQWAGNPIGTVPPRSGLGRPAGCA